MHQMRIDKLCEPFWRLLTEVSLQLGFQDSVRETTDFLFVQLGERVIDAYIRTTPDVVVFSTDLTVCVILANETDVGV